MRSVMFAFLSAFRLGNIEECKVLAKDVSVQDLRDFNRVLYEAFLVFSSIVPNPLVLDRVFEGQYIDHRERLTAMAKIIAEQRKSEIDLDNWYCMWCHQNFNWPSQFVPDECQLCLLRGDHNYRILRVTKEDRSALINNYHDFQLLQYEMCRMTVMGSYSAKCGCAWELNASGDGQEKPTEIYRLSCSHHAKQFSVHSFDYYVGGTYHGTKFGFERADSLNKQENRTIH